MYLQARIILTHVWPYNTIHVHRHATQERIRVSLQIETNGSRYGENSKDDVRRDLERRVVVE